MKRTFTCLLISFILLFFLAMHPVYAATNPYQKYQDLYGITTVRCTWYAWEQAYENAGVALPGWGNAQTWYNEAINDGYKVGQTARANSIAVWSSSDGYGHVGYVTSVNGEEMKVNEGGIVTTENEGIVNGSTHYTTAANLIGFIYLDEVPKKENQNNSDQNSTVNEPAKSNNANLQNIMINIANFTFDPNITVYELEVPYETQIITIAATKEDETSLVFGTGQKALKVGKNAYTLTVIAEDETTKEYQINITRKEREINEEEIRTEETEEEKNHSVNSFYIFGIILILLLLIVILVLFIRKKQLVLKKKEGD